MQKKDTVCVKLTVFPFGCCKFFSTHYEKLSSSAPLINAATPPLSLSHTLRHSACLCVCVRLSQHQPRAPNVGQREYIRQILGLCHREVSLPRCWLEVYCVCSCSFYFSSFLVFFFYIIFFFVFFSLSPFFWRAVRVFAAHFELPSPSCSLSCYGNFTPSPFQGQKGISRLQC